jgi:glyoxylase-like metal-dependent hydrolase (beta-lactamase superfamily II)
MTRAAVEVAPGVHVMTSRRYATTSTAVIADGEALVVDPCWDADELAGVAAFLRSIGARCAAGLATHLHYDHVLWHPDLGEAPRWSSAWAASQWSADRASLVQPLIGDIPDDLVEFAGRVEALPAHDVPWPGRDIVLHEHDAHARGHLAVEITDAGVLLAGDMLSDVELPYPDADEPNLESYLAGLDRLTEVVRRSRVLVPGHGTPTYSPIERLDADRRYLDAVLVGRPVDDRRLADPDNQEIHARTVEQARATDR